MAIDYNDMSDDELEAAFNAAKADMESPEFSSEEQQDSDNLDTQDSDLNGSGDEVAEEVEVESTEADGSPDGDTEVDEEPTTEAEANTDDLLQPVQKYRYKANGKEYEFSEQEIKEKFPQVFAQAMDYTKKMQTIKPWRKTIDAIEQNKLSHDDVSLMIDVLKGDKTAIAAVLKRTGVDTLELDTDEDSNKYVPKSYGRDESTLAIKDVVDEISQDQEYAVTSRIIDKEWDDGSWKEISSNPVLIKQLHIDVKNGDFAKVQPIAEKMKLYNPGQGTDIDYYRAAARVYYGELAQQKQYEQRLQAQQQVKQGQVQQERKVAEVKQKEIQRTTTTQAAAKRKAAAPTNTSGGKPTGIIDYLDASEEDYDSWYKAKIQGR